MRRMKKKLPPPNTRAEQIYRAFRRFHRRNPEVWRLFKKFTFKAINAGRGHYSARDVVHRIRWHTSVETVGEPIKINDHYSPYYGRMFIACFPKYKDFFELRHRVSEDKTPYDVDIQVFNFGPAISEAALFQRLEKLARETE